ncbi:hypothetical protein TWF730_002114 [Orbilia blumenaviensis]|uniref:WD40 repeat-like protein n=1 Tax=Orbilia blumenaviensis TaxID=1796055 RepID=A0AAV9UDX6_9PEZI
MADDAQKHGSKPKSSKPKPKKNNKANTTDISTTTTTATTAAENADAESTLPSNDASSKNKKHKNTTSNSKSGGGSGAVVAAATIKPSKERKDRRFADLTPDAKQAKRREERQKRKKALETSTNPVAVADEDDEELEDGGVALAIVDKDASLTAAPSKPFKQSEKPSLRIKREKRESLKAKEWKVSQPIGGRYSTNNLVFSPDEKYILLAQGPSLKVFSTKTSLLYRTLQHLRPPPTQFPYSPAGNYSSIANYTIDPVNPSQVYTILFNGDLLLWDYTEGTIEGYWKTDLHQGQYLAWSGLCALPSPASESQGKTSTTATTSTTLWTYHEHSLHDFSRKTVREIRELTIPPTTNNTPSTTEEEEPVIIPSRLILTIEGSRPRHLVIVDSNTFTVDSGEFFYIGNRQRAPPTTTTTTESTTNAPDWRIRKISAPGKISSIDAIIRHKKSVAGTIQGDVAVGDNTGQIFVYHDVLNPTASSAAKVIKSKLHWHRSAVGCVKYSKDGTYLISGGRETVLILWQLSTSSRQTLPNLGASIKSIFISPTGSSYALILADNSILTISTTELKPTSSINGIQSRVFLREEYIRDKRGLRRPKREDAWRIPVLKHPWNDMQILLAAPASQKGERESAYPYLQTYDLAQDKGVARQAITRTLVSMKNSNPEGGEVREPNVRFLAISGDGEWLASVDEWDAPARDFVDQGAPQPKVEERVGKEVVLRFWRWSGVSPSSSSSSTTTPAGTEPTASASGKGTWELISMIENPHGVLDNGSAGDVADLTGSPNGAMFSSIGSDGTVKIWGKRARTRAGVKSDKDSMVVWNCRRNLELFKPNCSPLNNNNNDDAVAAAVIRRNDDGRIAYSSDGSVIAVAYCDSADDEDDGVVVIIDPLQGIIKQEIGSLQTGRVFDVCFVGRYLIIAGSERVVVWNLVGGVAEWASELSALVGNGNKNKKQKKNNGVDLRNNNFIPNIQLAAGEGNTFAIAVNYPLYAAAGTNRRRGRGGEKGLTKAGNTASMISVFETEGFEVLCKKRAVNGVLALEAAGNGRGGQGYFWLDGAANVYFVSSGGVVSGGSGGAAAMNNGYLEDVIDTVGGLANAFLEKAVIEEDEEEEFEEEGGEGRVVRTHMLARLFPAPAYASPAVGDVFGRFMEIVGEKALDIPRSSSSSSNNTASGGGDGMEGVKRIGDDSADESEDDEFEDAHDGDADISMQDAAAGTGERDVYADLPTRDFDVIIDEA